jgi:hypothetical protein
VPLEFPNDVVPHRKIIHYILADPENCPLFAYVTRYRLGAGGPG